MTDPVRDIALGYQAVGITPDRLAAVAEQIEQVGIDSIWMAETNHDPFVGLAIAADRTARVAIHTGLAVAFARNPMSLAMQAYDMQLVSRGRFHLGLGSQIKTHVVRRFSMPWSQPAARMREFILATRAIWDSFETGRLRFRGEFYRHTMMVPFFNPGPNPYGHPPILLAGVGERMTEVAGEVADGFLIHTLSTRRYLDTVVLPRLARGRELAGKTMDGFRIHATPLVVTGSTEEEYERSAQLARRQIAEYASIPGYAAVLASEGLEGMQDELHLLAAQGRWEDMPTVVDDVALNAIATVGEPHEIGAKLYERFGDVVAGLSIYQYGDGLDPGALVPIYEDFRAAARKASLTHA